MKPQWVRAGLVVLAVPQAATGVWAGLAPRSWYRNFPGGGRHWISALGPFDDHLVRDVGFGLLALAALVLWSAVSLDPLLVKSALGAWLVFQVPHLVFHLSETEPLDTVDNVLNIGLLGVAVVLPLAIIALMRPSEQERRPAVGARA